MLVHENLIHLLIYFQLSRSGPPGFITLLIIFSPEELSIQRFESLGGNHLHVTFKCTCLRVTITLFTAASSRGALISHCPLPKREKSL